MSLHGFLTGPTSPEDIVEVPGADTAIVSGLSADPLSTDSAGHLYAVESMSGDVTEIWPDREWSVSQDRTRFPSCPGASHRSSVTPQRQPHAVGAAHRVAGRSRLGDVRASVDVPFLPDNLRLSDEGEVLVTGQDFTLDDVLACEDDDLDNCPTGLEVQALDPKRMTTRTLFDGEPAGSVHRRWRHR